MGGSRLEDQKCSHASDSYNYIKTPKGTQTKQTGSIYNNVVSGLYIILHFYKAEESEGREGNPSPAKQNVGYGPKPFKDF